MAKYIVKRILWLIPITLMVIVFVYTILFFAPGDTARVALGNSASEEALRKKPVLVIHGVQAQGGPASFPGN